MGEGGEEIEDWDTEGKRINEYSLLSEQVATMPAGRPRPCEARTVATHFCQGQYSEAACIYQGSVQVLSPWGLGVQ